MAVSVKGFIKRCATVLTLLMLALCFEISAASARPLQKQDVEVNKLHDDGQNHGAALAPDVIKILATLENRVGDRQRLLEKAEEKLAGLKAKDRRLIASLCDRIPADNRTAGSDIAFLLATALMVLS